MGVEIDQAVDRDDEITLGVDCLAGTDDRVPIAGLRIVRRIASGGMAGAGKIMRDEDGVLAFRIELSVPLETDLDVFSAARRRRFAARAGANGF